MRTSALISGVMSAAMVAAGVLMRISHVPGGVFLILIGTLLFLLVFLPLLLIYRLKTTGSAIGKVAAVFGLFAGWSLGTSLLFKNLHWPGGGFLFLIGILLTVVFLLLYFISIFRSDYQQQRFGIFDVVIVIFFGTFFAGAQLAKRSTAETQQMVQQYLHETESVKRMRKEVMDEIAQMEKDPADSAYVQPANELDHATVTLLDYIGHVKAELISHNTGYAPQALDIMPDSMQVKMIERPNDFDTPTHYMIGEDPANVTGKSKELKQMIAMYKNEELSKDIPLGIDLSDVQRNGKTISWEWANFYHTPVIDAMAYLEQLRMAVLEAEMHALKEKKFRTT